MSVTQNAIIMRETNPLFYTNRTSETKLPITRLVAIITIGAVMTFILFAVMHALIKQDATPVKPPEPFVMVSSILDIIEKPINERKPLPPPLDLPEKPTTPSIMPDKPDQTTGLSTELSIPKTVIAQDNFNIAPVDQQPRPIVRVPPNYPARPASNGIEGFVELRFGVSASGAVVDIEVLEAQPRNTFERAAKRALSKWKYQPKLVAGEAVGMSGLQVRLDFNLANDS